MSSQRIYKVIKTSVLSHINGLWSCLASLASRLMLKVTGVVHQIRSGSVANRQSNEFINIAEYKRGDIHNPKLEEDRAAVAFEIQAFHQCVLRGEQQAKCFTLVLLLVVFVGIVIVRLKSIS